MGHEQPLYLLEGQESERLMYRKITEADRPDWLVFCTDPTSLLHIFSAADIKSPEENCTVWFNRVYHRYANRLGGMNALVDKTTGQLVGQCGLLIQEVDGIEELEIGYSLMPTARHQGYATEAARKCRDFAFENNFRDSLISIVHVDNSASAKVARNNGMVLDKTTISKGDPVHIFRITKTMWLNNKP